MKLTSFALVSLSLCGNAFGQTAQPLPSGGVLHTPQPAPADLPPPASFSRAQAFRWAATQYYMRFPSPLQLGDQVLSGMGDEAARDMLLIIGSAPPLSAAQMQTAMDIIHKAFTLPYFIQSAADRKPVASLALLQKFQTTATDQLVKTRIAVENNFLNAVPTTFPPQIAPANIPEGPNPFPGMIITRGTPAH